MPPRPEITPSTIADDQLLAHVVDEVIHDDPDLRVQQAHVIDLQQRLRGLVTDDVWRLYLEVDETTTARFADALVKVARWAFTEGVKSCGRRSE